jgi:septal ring factor EnvC (AmiA/AmiB activator)
LFLTAARKRVKSLSMKSMTFIRGRFTPALLVSGVLFIAGCGNQDAELATQRQKELETVRAELEQAKTSLAAQETELARLRKDNLEVLKLRNEVRQLRDDKQQLAKQAQTAQVQAQQAQTQVQVIQSQVQQTAQALAAQQQALAAQSRGQATPEQQSAMACINNLRLLDGAMQQWALENRKDASAVPTAKEVAAYLKNGIPKCPAGGAYTLNSVGTVPTCSIPGHALPQ